MQPAAYPHQVREVRLVETHISWVLLTGMFAYKIKRPVRYPFIDLSSAEQRSFFCEEELRLNRRFAPELYVEACDITEESGRVRMGGAGRVIERCVKMRQFDRENELDRLLEGRRIEAATLEAFGRDLARIHTRLPVAQGNDVWGSAGKVRKLVVENLKQYLQGAARAGFETAANIPARIDERLAKLASSIDVRRASGRVRECHGDLHTRNIVLIAHRLLAFDCIEFEPAFRWIDVAEEVALLAADLRARGRRHEAHAFVGGYLAESGDFELLRVLDLYVAHRALTRAKIAALEKRRDEFAALSDEAGRALEERRTLLVLMTGVAGSGKTWLARRVAADIDAVHLRSDVERKRLAGLEELAISQSAVGEGLYASDVSDRVYQHLANSAGHALTGGHSVMVDATFLRRSQRALFSSLATSRGVPLKVVVCEAPLDTLRERIRQRHAAASDASEANLSVLDWQLAHQEPIDPSEHLHIVRVSATTSNPVDDLSQISTP